MYFQKIMSVVRGKILRVFYSLNMNISIGKNVRIGRNVFISARSGGKITIGNNVIIGSGSDVSALNGGVIMIGNGVAIGTANKVISHKQIIIGDNTLLAPNVNIYDHDHVFDINGVKRKEYKTGNIEIGNNCWIGINSVILKNTSIGNNCLIAACSVIKGHFSDGCKIIQKRITESSTV